MNGSAHLSKLIPVAVSLCTLLTTSLADAQGFSVPNFVSETLFFEAGTTGIDFGPTGVLYAAEKQGIVRYATPDGQGGYNDPQVLIDIRGQVDSESESGLLDVEVDPEFSTNRYLYVFFTTGSDQRLVRYTLNAAGTSASSPVTILSGLPRSFAIHKAGDIEFRPGELDNIYIALGDDGRPNTAPDLDELGGKILRVDKITGLGLTTNPFYAGAADTNRARIWAYGMRNPFRFVFHPIAGTPGNDVLYVSENGDGTDKMAWVRAGSNGGWSPAGDGPFIDVVDPDHRVLQAIPNASPVGIAIAESGPFSDGGQPVIYLSTFIGEPTVLRWRLTGPNLDTAVAVAADNGQPFASDLLGITLKFGPDGALYYTLAGGGNSTFGLVGRVRFVGGAAPNAGFSTSPNPAQGQVPLTVDFTDQSSDSDGTIQSRAWDFGDGTTSSAVNPSHTYASAGVYTAQLVVTDDDGLTDSAQAQVTVVSPFVLNLRGQIADGNFLDGRVRSGTTQLRFYQNDGTPISISGGLGPNGNGLNVADGDIQLDVPLNLTSDFVVITVGENEAAVATQTIALEVDTSQASQTRTIAAYPATTAIRGQVVDTRGDPARVDLGLARDDISTLYPVPNGRDYLPTSGIDQTGVDHRIVSDAGGYFYFPLRDAGDYFIDVVGDTGTDAYLAALTEGAVASLSDVLELTVTVGLQTGGAGCDDLSAIAPVSNVDYGSQIQPLWDTCIGCHKPNSPNGGGLDLTAANSYAAMVDVASVQVPGRLLVAPSEPDDSYLMEKISCSNPQVGNRMRQGDPYSLQEQALIRDWIAQGALQSSGSGEPRDGGFVNVDGGFIDTDGGFIESDGGFIAVDGGLVPVDGGLVPVDDDDDVSGSGSSGGCAVNGAASAPTWVVSLGLIFFGIAWRRRRAG